MANEETDDSFEVDGHFWLPSDPNKTIAGILTFDRDRGGELSLIGSFSSVDDLFNNTARETRTIHGRSEKHGYTLDGCLTSHQSLKFAGGVGRQRFSVAQVVKGALFGPDEDIAANAVVVDLTYLLEWTALSGVEVTVTTREGGRGHEELRITSTPVETKVCRIPGGRLKLIHSIVHSSDWLKSQTVKQHVQARFEFDTVRKIEDALDSVSDLQDLLTFGNDRVVAFESVRLEHPDLIQKLNDDEVRQLDAQLFARWRARAKKSTTRTHMSHDMCFTYDDLGGINGIERWMAVAAKYRSHVGRIANTKYNQHAFLGDILLARVATLESLHESRFPGKLVTEASGKTRKPYLSERIDDLTGLAGEPWKRLFGESGSDREDRIATWRDRAKSERNNVAHHLGRDLRGDVSEMYYVSEAAYWLFLVIILRLAEAPDTVYERLRDQPRFMFTGQQLLSFL